MHQAELTQQLLRLRRLWRRQQHQAVERSSQLLNSLARELRQTQLHEEILAANQLDLAKLEPSHPMYDRLLLNKQRLLSIASDLERVAALPSPVGQELYRHRVQGDAEVRLCRASIGLVLVIYESRPNVTLDLFSLALRSGNMLLLKGGKEALESNTCLEALIRRQLHTFDLAAEWATLLGTSRRELTLLLEQQGLIDLCIPRGSAALIRFVREHSRLPTIETGAGVVHLFCDESAQTAMAASLIANSKLRRLSVCNALDCLLLHENRLSDLGALVAPLASASVRLWADEQAYSALQECYPEHLLTAASSQSFGQEFLCAQLCIKVVDSLAQAIAHIEQYGSQHTEVIVTEDSHNAQIFCQQVDAAAVFVNLASGFCDGGQFGLGAEVGISTQKLHARGPMGLEALTCTKWLGQGGGEVRR